VLAQSFRGQASHMVAQAGGSVSELVRLITAHFPGFRDEAVYRGRQVRVPSSLRGRLGREGA
jgi:hypothetical protein